MGIKALNRARNEARKQLKQMGSFQRRLKKLLKKTDTDKRIKSVLYRELEEILFKVLNE